MVKCPTPQVDRGPALLSRLASPSAICHMPYAIRHIPPFLLTPLLWRLIRRDACAPLVTIHIHMLPRRFRGRRFRPRPKVRRNPEYFLYTTAFLLQHNQLEPPLSGRRRDSQAQSGRTSSPPPRSRTCPLRSVSPCNISHSALQQ